MARAVASSFSPKIRFAVVAAAIALSGCVGSSVFDDLNSAQPTGSAFNESQFKYYSTLARSFGTAESPAGQAFDAEGAISLTGADNTVSGLANAYAQKALAAARAEDVLPEVADESDADAENVRLELLRDLDEGRDKAPDKSARAQADYDCWLMNRRVPELKAASQACRHSVTASLAKLERILNPAPAPAPTPDASASAAPAAPTAPDTTAPAQAPVAAPSQPVATAAETAGPQFEVLFASRSAQIPLNELSVVAQAINAARTGRQSRIQVIGHTDGAENSRALSLRRAEAVEAALVQQGARPEAIAVSGVGKSDPAVPGDAREPKNRRVVITLVP